MIENIEIQFNELNVSAQVGDVVYASTVSNVDSSEFNSSPVNSTKIVGPIISINGGIIIVAVDLDTTTRPPDSSFFSFAKNKIVNTSEVLGYYAKVDFFNDSKDKVELFSVGSEIVESSK